MVADAVIQKALDATDGISTDSRTARAGNLFFALKGECFDGHDFLKQALERGIKNFVVSDQSKILPWMNNAAHFIWVSDTLKAYGDFAAIWRERFKIPAVAVTGSSGKTTVKELIAHLLSPHFKVLKNRGTENNLVGVPKTLFCLEKNHAVLVVELGTNHPGEIDRLASLLTPDIGVITQIGSAHLEGLGSLEDVCREKLSLMNHLRKVGRFF